MTVVVDTNVIVSGLLSPAGPPGEILRMVASGQLRLCYDARVLAEYRTVLARQRFGFDQDLIRDFLEQIEHSGVLAMTTPIGERFTDDDDRPFAEVAMGCQAAYLITGNLRHFPSPRYGETEVVQPAQFIDLVRGETQ